MNLDAGLDVLLYDIYYIKRIQSEYSLITTVNHHGVPWELSSLNRVWAYCQDTSSLVTSTPRTNKGGPQSIQK